MSRKEQLRKLVKREITLKLLTGKVQQVMFCLFLNINMIQCGSKISKVTINAGVIISYRVIIGISRENRLSKHVLLRGNVYTVV